MEPIDKQVTLNISGKDVGSALLRDYQDEEIFITNFELKPEYRGQGLGQKALSLLTTQYGANSLSVGVDNDRAKHIYLKAGFKIVGEPYFDENAEQWLHYMKK